MQVKTIAFLSLYIPGRRRRSRNLQPGPLLCQTRLQSTSLYLEAECGTAYRKNCEKSSTSVRCPTPNGFRGVRNTDFLCESLKTERADVLFIQATTDIAFEQIRTRTTAKNHFLPAQHAILGGIRPEAQEVVGDPPPPTLTRRLEYALLRKPAYRLTRKLEQRYAPTVHPGALERGPVRDACPGYSDEFERDPPVGTSRLRFPRERLTAMLNPMLPTQEPAKTPKEKIVLYAGRFQRCHKRIDRLLKIWKRIEQQNPEWRLVIVGDGEERGDLEKQARRLKLQRIEFAGYQYDVTPFYRRATFVCLTSNFEGLPMCLMEGQQYGAIPVSFRLVFRHPGNHLRRGMRNHGPGIQSAQICGTAEPRAGRRGTAKTNARKLLQGRRAL